MIRIVEYIHKSIEGAHIIPVLSLVKAITRIKINVSSLNKTTLETILTVYAIIYIIYVIQLLIVMENLKIFRNNWFLGYFSKLLFFVG